MNGKLTKAEIIENIHDKLGTDRKDIHAVIDGGEGQLWKRHDRGASRLWNI